MPVINRTFVRERKLPNLKQIEEELAKHGFFLENWRRAARKAVKTIKRP